MKINNNGKWEDVRFKVSDTLPVGSVIDYDGTEIPAGWKKDETYVNVAIDTTLDGHDEEVVLIGSRNLLDKNKKINVYPHTNNYLEELTGGYSYYVEIQPNTTYTISRKTLGTNPRGIIAETSLFPKIGNPSKILDSNNESLTFTITTSSTAKYLIVFLNRYTTDTIGEEIQVEKSITKHDYEPYVKTTEIYANGEKYTDTLSIGPEPNNSGLWLEPSRGNICDNSKLAFGYIEQNGTFNSGENGWETTDYIEVIGGSYSLTATGSITRVLWCEYDSSKNVIGSRHEVSYGNNINIQSSSAKYIRISVNNQTASNVVVKDLGATPSIKVNNNGIYETIVNKNVYLSSEVVIGEFMGKPLYRKVINFGALPNTTTKGVNFNISNLEMFTNITGIATSGTNTIALPYVHSNSIYNVGLSANTTQINIVTSSDRTSYTKCYVTLEYTKKTD